MLFQGEPGNNISCLLCLLAATQLHFRKLHTRQKKSITISFNSRTKHSVRNFVKLTVFAGFDRRTWVGVMDGCCFFDKDHFEVIQRMQVVIIRSSATSRTAIIWGLKQAVVFHENLELKSICSWFWRRRFVIIYWMKSPSFTSTSKGCEWWDRYQLHVVCEARHRPFAIWRWLKLTQRQMM